MNDYLDDSRNLKKIVVCGFGNMGKKYVQNLQLYWPYIEVSLLRSKSFGNNYERNICKQFINIDDAIAWQPDAAIISSPASFHLIQALSFSKFRIPILIEKPICIPKDDSQSLIELEKRSRNLPILVGYILRHEPSIEYLKKLLDEKRIGKILELDLYCGSWLPEWRENIDYKNCVSSNKNLGGGVLLELSHEIDLAHYLFGEFKILGANISNSNILEINVEDQVCILGVTKNNIQITIRLNFCSKPYKRVLNLRGTEGEIHWDLFSGDFLVLGNDHQIDKHNFRIEPKLRLRNQIMHFFECIAFQKEPICSVSEGIEVLNTIKKVKEFTERFNKNL